VVRPHRLEDLALVEENRPLGGQVFLLRLAAPWVAGRVQPGQFVMVGCADPLARQDDPLLLRPLGVAGKEGETISLLVRIKGRGTGWLAGRSPGEPLKVRGPLGRAFPKASGERVLLLAGGIGLPPLLLAHQLLAGQGRCLTEMILGVPDGSWKGVADYTRSLVPGLTLTSDDGSLGTRGNALSALPPEPEEVWACGPKAMLSGLVSRLPAETRVWVSLEARMGCGYGGCYGCSVPVRGGLSRACTEGPVFEGREVRWDELA